MDFFTKISQTAEAIISKAIGMAAMLTHCQPKKWYKVPEKIEDIAIPVKTIKSLVPCTFPCSAGVWTCVNSLVPAVNEKFQPMPSNNKDTQKKFKAT